MKAELSLLASGHGILYFVYKILILMGFIQLLRMKERGEGNIFCGKEL